MLDNKLQTVLLPIEHIVIDVNQFVFLAYLVLCSFLEEFAHGIGRSVGLKLGEDVLREAVLQVVTLMLTVLDLL